MPGRDVSAQNPVTQRAGERLRGGDGLQLERHDAAASGRTASARVGGVRDAHAQGGRCAQFGAIGRDVHHAAGGRAGTVERGAEHGAGPAAGDHRGEGAVKRAQRSLDELGLDGGDGECRDVETFEHGAHRSKRTAGGGHRTDGVCAGRCPPESPLLGERVDRWGKPAELGLEGAQSSRERAAAVHRHVPVAARELADEPLLRTVQINQHAAERQRHSAGARGPLVHARHPTLSDN